MSDDLIRRRDAIDAMCDNCGTSGAVCAHYPCQRYLAIESLPSAQPEPRWIPCSERLPELDQEVLVYAIGKVDGFGDSVIAMSKRHIFRLFSSSEGVEVWTSPWPYFSSNYEITHWMPLPKPPKGEEE